MECLPPDPGPNDGLIRLDYARPQPCGGTPLYVRALTSLVSFVAVLIAIPFGGGGIVMVWGWMAGTDTADGHEGVLLLIASMILAATGAFGMRAAYRNGNR